MESERTKSTNSDLGLDSDEREVFAEYIAVTASESTTSPLPLR